ncbi:MAG: YlxR family protein [bacterium]
MGCRDRRPKPELVRFVLSGGGLTVGNVDGRGTYICRSPGCLEKALRRRSIRGLTGDGAGEGALAALRDAVTGEKGGRGGDDSRRVSRGASGGGVIG